MKKQKILKFALLSSVCIALSCSNSLKPATDLGQQIVKDVDPNLLDISRNVKSYSGDLPVTAMSMVDERDTFPPGYFWNYNGGFIVAGKNVGLSTATSEEVISYLEFRPLTFRNDATTANDLKTGIIDSVVLKMQCFRIKSNSSSHNDTTPAGRLTSISVFSSPIASGYSTIKGRTTDTIPFTSANLSALKSSTELARFSVNTDSASGDTVVSLKLDTSIFTSKFKNAVKDNITPSDTAAFALCLASNEVTDGLGRFWNYDGDSRSPTFVVYYHANAADTLSIHSHNLLRDHATYSVLESNLTNISASPISSWENFRRAVYTIDVSPLKTFMDTAGPDSLKYVVIQKADIRIPVLKTFSDLAIGDSIQVNYKVINSDSVVNSVSSFSGSNSFLIHNTSDTSYTIPIASMLQPLIINRNSKSVKLYLTLQGKNSTNGALSSFIQIAWKPDTTLKLNAIVTNPR